MDFDRYFQARGDMVSRILLDQSASHPVVRDRLMLAAGASCLIAPPILECWAGKSLVDPRYCAQFSAVMIAAFTSGVILLSTTQAAYVLVGRWIVSSRHKLIENTLSQLLKIDATIAHRIVGRPSTD